jgi:tetratricopeptide (TPR) repeat protein
VHPDAASRGEVSSEGEGELQTPLMSSRIAVILVSILATLPGVASLACAQDADSLRTRADSSLNAGHYDEARRFYQDLLDLEMFDAAIGYGRTFEAVGEYEAGLEAVDSQLRSSPDAPALLCAKGRLLTALGRYQDAGNAFNAAFQEENELWSCAADFADLLARMGNGRDARYLHLALYDRYERGVFRTARDLAAAGRAAAALGQFREANNAFRTAHEVDSEDAVVLYEWGELFRQKFNDADARRTYEQALAINPRHAPSLVGLARATGGFERQEELAQQALSVNPNLTDALDVLAGLRILDGMYDEAESLVHRALAINPHSTPSLAQVASTQFLRGDEDGFEETEQQALRIEAEAGEFYLKVAENATRRFRYPDAATFAERAVEVDGDNPLAHAELGAALLRLGRRSEARRHVEFAYEEDPYNLFAANTLTLLDTYDDFALLESANFQLLIHTDERDVLGPLVLEVAEASFDSLSSRYPYEPSGKILIEAYNDPDDFAVRIAGVPHAGLLGVSFGDVVAINTPRAQTGETYNWARTLWHEIAHTMAIGTSNHHVPRWLTEGLSVYEEQRARPEWGRELELAFLSAFEEDALLPLEEIDRGFTRPAYSGQVLLSYFHAGKVIGFIAEEFGFDSVTRILEVLATGASQEEAMREATGVGLAEVDRRFREDVQRRRREVAVAIGDLPDLPSSREDGTASEREASGPFFDHLREGAEHLAREDFSAAESSYKAAIALYPDYVGPQNAYEGLAAIYRAAGRQDDLTDVLRRYVDLAEDEVDAALELAGIYEERGDDAAAAAMLARSLHVAPYDADVRNRLAGLYDEEERFDAAVIHRQAVVALGPPDKAGAYYRLARSMYRSGDVEEARRAVLQSLETAPDFREAQKLLLELPR